MYDEFKYLGTTGLRKRGIGNREVVKEVFIYIGEYRTWTGDLIRKLSKGRPKTFERLIKDLIKRDIIKIRKTFIFDEIARANISKLDYSLMDEFSIRLFNALYYKTSNLDDLIISK